MAKHSATYLQAQLYCAIVRTALKHGAERVEADPVSGRITVIRRNGGTTVEQPNGEGVEPPETPDELRKLL
jgi:hypothetical protein